MPGQHEETPYCLGVGKVALYNLQKPFSNPYGEEWCVGEAVLFWAQICFQWAFSEVIAQ